MLGPWATLQRTKEVVPPYRRHGDVKPAKQEPGRTVQETARDEVRLGPLPVQELREGVTDLRVA
jgi:hypothetical protein